MFQWIIVDKVNTSCPLLSLSCCVTIAHQTNISLSAHMPGKKLCGKQKVCIAIKNNKAAIYETKQLFCFSSFCFFPQKGRFSPFRLARRTTRESALRLLIVSRSGPVTSPSFRSPCWEPGSF